MCIQNAIRKYLAVALSFIAAQQPTLLRNATLIDVTEAPPREHMDVTFANGLFQSITRTKSTTPMESPSSTALVRPSFPDISEHRELEDLFTACLTPLQAITVATGATGELVHTLGPILNVGLVFPGYSTDIVVLSANPPPDIHNTCDIAAICHHGHTISNPAPKN